MPDLITIGETMLAFVPKDDTPIETGPSLEMRIAGAESNTAIGLVRLGHSASWISRVGDDAFGRFITDKLASEGVDTSQVIVDSEHQTGIMFKQPHLDAETTVQYYRAQSAASFLRASDLDPDYFKHAKILHITGITPVLSESCYETILASIDLARKYNLLISFDPNIRQKIWGQVDYIPRLLSILNQSNIVLLGLSEAKLLFGSDSTDHLLEAMFMYSKVHTVAIKNGNQGAIVANRTERYKIDPIPCNSIDPVGAGDGFNAGFLHGVLEGADLRTAGLYGGIVGALATETIGDTEGYPSLKQLETIAKEGGDRHA